MKSATLGIIGELVREYPALAVCADGITDAVNICVACYENGGKLLTCGNGGSAADAQHIVGELMKDFTLPRPLTNDDADALRTAAPADAVYLTCNLQRALPAVSLIGEASLSTAFANDRAPDLVFAQQVFGIGKAGDVLLAISTSGNSANVVYAAAVARAKRMSVVALTGASGGKLRAYADASVAVPAVETYRVQELHLPVYHCICRALENEFFGA